jgi:NADH:ubiquinone oxidoreductase subunit 5 (subunit L)/multisubunit Na+/H+ antiporter MnhA subunit
MNQLLQLFIFIPFLGFIISLLIPDKNEGTISWVAFLTAGINLVSLVIFVIIWLIDGHTTLNLKEIVLFKSKEYEFLVDLCFDKITVVYILVGAFLTFLVTIYSSYYLHR